MFTARYGLDLYILFTLSFVFVTVSRLRRSVASLSPRSLVFDHRSAHVDFVMDKVALAESFLTVFVCSGCLDRPVKIKWFVGQTEGHTKQ